MHKRLVFSIISRAVFIVCFFMLLPLAWAVYDNPSSLETSAFVVTICGGLLCSVLGRVLFAVKERDFEGMNAKDALASVGLIWVFLSVWGALPLWLSQSVGSFTDAFFETASGFTTTGASILTNIEILPRGVLFWRSLTHWLGGMGVVVLYVALLPALGGNAFQLYKAETSGVSIDRAVPRLKENAISLWLIYVLLSAACFMFLVLGEMPVFDALCHTFGAVATGGFSTQNASMGAYSPYIQWVIVAFMFLGGVNFLLYYRVFQGRPLALVSDEEFRFFLGMAAVFSVVFTAVLMRNPVVESPVRHAIFQVVAILTTTGYVTADFDRWPDVLRGAILVFMFIGGCAGSTGGGFKIVRLLLSLKIAFQSVVKAIYPSAIVPVRFNGKTLSEKMALSILIYFSVFVFLICGGTLFLLFSESTDILTALSASLSAISSIGPGLSGIGPTGNFQWMSAPGKWMLSFLMIAGRLELYAFLILFLPATWKK